MNLRLNFKFIAYVILLSCAAIHAQAQSHCTNGITKWADIRSLAPIKGLDLNKIFSSKSLRLNANGKTYTLKERGGNIYVQAPQGSSNVKVCKISGNKIQITASVLGIRRTVVVEVKGGRSGVLHTEENSIPFNATY